MIIVRQLEESDLLDIVGLRARIAGYPLPHRGVGFYRWKFFEGPHPARVFVAEAEGSVVALTTLSVRSAWIDGAHAQVGELGDFFTDPQYRRQGLFKRLLSTALEAGGDLAFFYCRPNDLSFPGLIKYGGFREHFQLRVGRKLSTLADAVAWLKLPIATRPQGEVACRAIPVDGWPPDLARAIDAQIGARYDFALRRDPTTIDWRFGRTSNPFRHFAFLDDRSDFGFGGVVTFKSLRGGDWAMVESHFLSPPPQGLYAELWRHLARLPDAPRRIFTWTSSADRSRSRALREAGFLLSRPQLHFTICGQAPPPSRCLFQAGDTDGF
jgi:GNAT superfamily N-acetyltransferase